MPGFPHDVKVEVAFTTDVDSGAPAWEDISDRLRGFTTSRGRQYDTDIAEPGQLTLELDNVDGVFHPDAVDSPFWPFIRPNRRVRVSAQQAPASGRLYLFSGYVDSWRSTWPGGGRDQVTTVRATDRFKLYARRRYSEVRPAESASARIAAVLNAAAVPLNQLAINPDNYLSRSLVAHTYDQDGLLTVLSELVRADGGLLFVNGFGVTTFQSVVYRLSNIRSTSSQSNWGNTSNNLSQVPIEVPDPRVDSQLMANRVSVTDGTGVQRVAQDNALVLEDGLLEFDLGATLLQPTDAQSRANDLLAARKTARPRYGSLTLDALTSDEAMTQAFARELSDRITVSVRLNENGQTSARDQFIEQVSHDVRFGRDAQWLTTFSVSAVP